jgi:uncharacterized protein
MTLDEIRHQLSTARGIPEAAVAAAVQQAEALVPDVLRLMELASNHVLLTRPEERLLFYGVHALAAARRTELYDPLLRLIERRSDDLGWLFNDASLHTLLISSHAPGKTVPYELLANPEIHGDAKSDLFLFAAWLVWQGHAPRDELVEFLSRFDRDESTDPDDFAWFGWQSAIELLGLTEFEDRVRAGWKAGRMRHDRDVDREGWISELHQAAGGSADKATFSHFSAEPIDDVPAALRRIAFFGFGRMTYGDELDAADPARDIRLMTDEQQWLEVFLASDVAPPYAMSLECLDGYLTALAVGPEEMPREVWWPRIWSESGTELRDFSTELQEPYVRALLDRHFETIQRRLRARYRHVPWIEEDSPLEQVEEWAIGFSAGLDLRPGQWDRIAEHEHASLGFAAIAMLLPAEQAGELNLPKQTEDSRSGILGKLPDIIRQFYAFWHGQPVQPLFGPRRSQKIGRNEPCPCGSGRKYKKCCGANAPTGMN